VTDEKLIAQAATVIRQGDHRVDVSLRGHLADMLDALYEHADSEYPCCDNGIRQCWEFGAAAMPLIDEIVRPYRKEEK
jgi:hypothetical protein